MNLKKIREERKITQSQLSDMCGISQNYISELENEKHEATEYIIIRLCIGLGIEPNELLGWRDIIENIKKNF